MPCPTCDHTMQGLGEVENGGPRYYWCPRCGTLRSQYGTAAPHDDVPTLPSRLRHCLAGLTVERARVQGLYESIMPPDDRPKD